MLKTIVKNVRRIWLQYSLTCLLDQQATIDRVIAEAEAELEQLRKRHETETVRMGRERTAIRTELIRTAEINVASVRRF